MGYSFSCVPGSPVGPDLGPQLCCHPMGKKDVGCPTYTVSPVCTQSFPEKQLLSLYFIYTVGYALSFSALVIASAILLGFR